MNTQVSASRMQTLFTDLRADLAERLPKSVLTQELNINLQKRLHYFVNELSKRGPVNEQEVKRLTYDAITKWIRSNTLSRGMRNTKLTTDTMTAMATTTP